MDEDGVILEPRNTADRVQPVHHLTFHRYGNTELTQHLRGPGAQADHQLPSGVRPTTRNDPHPRGGLVPIQHGFTKLQCGPRFFGDFDMCAHCQLRSCKPGFGVVERDIFGVGREVREPGGDLGGVEQLMRQIPLAAGAQATGYDQAVRWPDEKAPGESTNVTLGVGSQLLPQLVGAQQQRK